MKNRMSPGSIAYAIGIFGSLLLGVLSAVGLFEYGIILTTVLILAGIVIGIFNISRKETLPFMVSGLVIAILSGAFSQLPFVAEFIQKMLTALVLVISPAVVVVAVKSGIKWSK